MACDTGPVTAEALPTTWDRYGNEIRTGIVLLVAVMVAAVASLGQATEPGLATADAPAPRGSLGATSSTTSTSVATTEATDPVVPVGPVAVAPPQVQPSAPTVIVIGGGPGGGSQPPTTQPARQRYENGPVPPSIRIVSRQPQNPGAGEDVRLVFTAGDPDGFVAGWAIDWGDGSSTTQPYDIPCAANPSTPDHEYPPVNHRYREIGDYRITVLLVTRGSCGFGPGQQATDQVDVRVGVPLPI